MAKNKVILKQFANGSWELNINGFPALSDYTSLVKADVIADCTDFLIGDSSNSTGFLMGAYADPTDLFISYINEGDPLDFGTNPVKIETEVHK